MPSVSVKAQSASAISVDWSFDSSEQPPSSVTVSEFNASGALNNDAGTPSVFGWICTFYWSFTEHYLLLSMVWKLFSG